MMQYTLLLCYAVTYYLKILRSRLVFFESGQKYDVDYVRSHAYNMAGRGLQPHQKWSQNPTAPQLNMKKPLIFVLSNQNIPGLPFCNFLCVFPGAHWLESFFHFTSYFYNSVLAISIEVSIPKYFFSIIGHSA